MRNRMYLVLTNIEGQQIFAPLHQVARKATAELTLDEYVLRAKQEYDIVKVQLKTA